MSDSTQWFKYLSFDGILKTLQLRTIRLSSPKLFNDPFDFHFTMRPPLSNAELHDLIARQTAQEMLAGKLPRSSDRTTAQRKALGEFYASKFTEDELTKLCGEVKEELAPHLEAQIDTVNGNIFSHFDDEFVYCLTKDNANLLMWSHYADMHRGAVIQFQCIEKDGGSVFLAAAPVQYQKTVPTLGAREDWLSGRPREMDGRKIYKEILLTKYEDWKYEKEWRITVPMPKLKGEPYFSIGIDEKEIAAVYLGCKMPLEHKQALLTVLRDFYPHAKVFEAVKSRHTFALEFIEIKTA